MTGWIFAAIWAIGVGPAMWVILSVYVAMPHTGASREARAAEDAKDAMRTALLWPAVAAIILIGVLVMATNELMTRRALRLMGTEGLPDLRTSELAPPGPEKIPEVAAVRNLRPHPTSGASGVVKLAAPRQQDHDAIVAFLAERIRAQAGLPPMILGDGPEIIPRHLFSRPSPTSDFCSVCGWPADSLTHEEEHPHGI